MEEPKTTIIDIGHSLAKGGLGAIPLIGGVASEIFNMIIAPPIEKRKMEWMNNIAARLKDLEERENLDLGKLKDNEQFIDVVLQATSLALKTSQVEKIKAFQNVILNSAMGNIPENSKVQIFLNILDNLTETHLAVLIFINSPSDWYQQANRSVPRYSMNSISNILKEAFPLLKREGELIELIWNDLEKMGLHNTSGLNTTMTGEGVLSQRTTKLAREFLNFITLSE